MAWVDWLCVLELVSLGSLTNPSTNVPAPTFGPQGFVAPSEGAILAGVQQDLNTAFNTSFNFGTTSGGVTNPTPQGQLASSTTAIIGDSYAQFIYFTQQVDPAYAQGRMQDAIGRIYFIDRIPGSPTVQPCVCTGLQGVDIPIGALAVDNNSNLWVSQQSGTIPSSGNITLNFAFTQNGPNPGPTSLTIYQAIFGWDSISPSGNAVLGANVESRSQFELRRSQSTAVNSTGQLSSILGVVLALPGVLDAYITENDQAGPVTTGGITLNPNSLYICVLGGTSLQIAQAIWSRKAPGCSYTGNTSVTVTDPSPQYLPPLPSYLVSYETPTITTFAVVVTIKNNTSIPPSALAKIQNAIISGFAGTDGGPRARIGSLLVVSRYYGGILALGAWAELIQIQLGVSGASASIQGSISGTALTVTSVSSGALTAGQLLIGTGVIANGSAITIINQSSGSVGGTGVYILSQNFTIPGQAFTTTTLANDYQLPINWAPTVTANNIFINLV